MSMKALTKFIIILTFSTHFPIRLFLTISLLICLVRTHVIASVIFHWLTVSTAVISVNILHSSFFSSENLRVRFVNIALH